MDAGKDIKSNFPIDGRNEEKKTGTGSGTEGNSKDNNSQNPSERGQRGTGRNEENKLLGLALLEQKKPVQGKPKKKEEVKKPEKVDDSGITQIFVGGTLSAVFSVLENRLGSKWKISQSEIDSISEPASRLLDRYAKISPDWGDGLQLSIAMLLVVGSRLIPEKGESKENAEKGKIEPIAKNDDKRIRSSAAGQDSTKSILAAIQ